MTIPLSIRPKSPSATAVAALQATLIPSLYTTMQQFASSLLCILAAGDVASFSPSTTFTTRPTISTDAAYASSKHYNTNLFSMPDDPYPSDYDVEDLSTEKKVSVDIDEDDAIIRDELKRELLLLSSVTNRGQCASQEEENLVVDLVTQLEVRSTKLNSVVVTV